MDIWITSNSWPLDNKYIRKPGFHSKMRNRGLAADEEKKLYEVTLDNLLTNVGWHRKRTEPVCLGQASTNFAAPVLRHFQLQCSNFIFHTASDVNQLLDHIAKYFDG